MYKVMRSVFKYRKGFIAGITASLVLTTLMITANMSGTYAMEFKKQEMNQQAQKRDFLIDDKTRFVFAEYKLNHQEFPYSSYDDVVKETDEIMEQYGYK